MARRKSSCWLVETCDDAFVGALAEPGAALALVKPHAAVLHEGFAATTPQAEAESLLHEFAQLGTGQEKSAPNKSPTATVGCVDVGLSSSVPPNKSPTMLCVGPGTCAVWPPAILSVGRCTGRGEPSVWL